ncbi:hypothetical protein PI125_g25851 [Phytophthora idaei]|nr:hypothetical protein PI125_g25851 [Phytophthora idaei]
MTLLALLSSKQVKTLTKALAPAADIAPHRSSRHSTPWSASAIV